MAGDLEDCELLAEETCDEGREHDLVEASCPILILLFLRELITEEGRVLVSEAGAWILDVPSRAVMYAFCTSQGLGCAV